MLLIRTEKDLLAIKANVQAKFIYGCQGHFNKVCLQAECGEAGMRYSDAQVYQVFMRACDDYLDTKNEIETRWGEQPLFGSMPDGYPTFSAIEKKREEIADAAYRKMIAEIDGEGAGNDVAESSEVAARVPASRMPAESQRSREDRSAPFVDGLRPAQEHGSAQAGEPVPPQASGKSSQDNGSPQASSSEAPKARQHEAKSVRAGAEDGKNGRAGARPSQKNDPLTPTTAADLIRQGKALKNIDEELRKRMLKVFEAGAKIKSGKGAA